MNFYISYLYIYVLYFSCKQNLGIEVINHPRVHIALGKARPSIRPATVLSFGDLELRDLTWTPSGLPGDKSELSVKKEPRFLTLLRRGDGEPGLCNGPTTSQSRRGRRRSRGGVRPLLALLPTLPPSRPRHLQLNTPSPPLPKCRENLSTENCWKKSLTQ